MGDDIGLGSVCFCFSLNLHSAAQFVVYGPLMSLDDSVSLNPNQCYHPLITQLTLWVSLGLWALFHFTFFSFFGLVLDQCQQLMSVRVCGSRRDGQYVERMVYMLLRKSLRSRMALQDLKEESLDQYYQMRLSQKGQRLCQQSFVFLFKSQKPVSRVCCELCVTLSSKGTSIYDVQRFLIIFDPSYLPCPAIFTL